VLRASLEDVKNRVVELVLTMNFRQPSRESTFNVGIDLLF
jgi:hypothetical protein